MASRVTVTFKPNAAWLAQASTDSGMLGRAALRGAARAREYAKRNITAAGRVDTGALRQSIRSEKVRHDDQRITYQIGSPLKYAIYQHEGVGPVRPRRAKVLRFVSKKGQTVFTKRTRGFKGAPFLTDALKQLTVEDFTGRG